MKQTAVEWLFEQILLTPLDIRSINKCLNKPKKWRKSRINISMIMDFILADVLTMIKMDPLNIG